MVNYKADGAPGAGPPHNSSKTDVVGGTAGFWHCVYEVCPEKVQPLLINENGLCDIDVTWQPRTVHWNVHARTTMTSLY